MARIIAQGQMQALIRLHRRPGSGLLTGLHPGRVLCGCGIAGGRWPGDMPGNGLPGKGFAPQGSALQGLADWALRRLAHRQRLQAGPARARRRSSEAKKRARRILRL